MRPEEMVGQVLGHYRLILPLGYGGTATVFLAQDINLQREVAIKIFQPREGETQDFLRRFAREARVLAQLDHPNILPVYDYGEQRESAYLVMPRMAGGTLRDRLRGRRIPVAEALRLIGQVLNALQYAHNHGLIHRDIKPGNMLFKTDDTLLLSDFGLVKVLSTSPESTYQTEPMSISNQSISGTPDYMAPEQITGQAVPASDIYSMGVVLYEMLTGSRLFTSENYVGILMKHLYEEPRPICELNPEISPALGDAIMQALAKDPLKRYQRPIDFWQALTKAEASHQVLPSVNDLHIPASPVQATQLSETGRADRQSANRPAKVDQANMPAMAHVNAGPSYAVQQSPLPLPNHQSVTLPASRERSRTPVIVALLLIILVLAASLGGVLYEQGLLPLPLGQRGHTPQTSPTAGIGTVTKGGSTNVPVGSASSTPTTQNMSSQPITCPDAGKARAAVIVPLSLGNNQNLIYVVNEGAPAHPLAGTIKRRDITAGTPGIEIRKMPNLTISEAQVSTDGRWVLFTAIVAGLSELRLVRVDGQGLQTLYCAPTNSVIAYTQWSYNQQFAIFNVTVGTDKSITYLLDLTNGQVQPEFVPQANLAFVPRTWIDNRHVYLFATNPTATSSPQGVYLLDIQKGPNQHESDLQVAATTASGCADFDSSYDNSHLIFSTCNGSSQGTLAGPSTITLQANTGGPATTIYASETQAITMVRAISPTTLLFLIENTNGDTAMNGLWRINIDGKGLARLTTDTTNDQALCKFTQYAWSNVSRDGKLFALQSYDQPKTYDLSTGSLSLGTFSAFAGINDGTQLLLAGWTNMA